MMARVRGVIRSATPAGSIRRYVGSQSTSTGVPPASTTASAVAMKVFAGRITSWPFHDLRAGSWMRRLSHVAGGVTSPHLSGRHGAGRDRTHTYDRVGADLEVLAHKGAGADVGARTDVHTSSQPSARAEGGEVV